MEKDKGGRPTTCTPEVVEKLCQKISEGYSINQVCMMEGFPVNSTVYKWLYDDRDIEGTSSKFSEKFYRAREISTISHADSINDLCLSVKDEELDPQQAHVIFKAKSWMASRLGSKNHVEKKEVDHKSSDGSMSPKDTQDAVLQAIKAKHADS